MRHKSNWFNDLIWKVYQNKEIIDLIHGLHMVTKSAQTDSWIRVDNISWIVFYWLIGATRNNHSTTQQQRNPKLAPKN